MFEVIHDEEEFVLVNKPAGISFHSEDGAGFVVQVESQLDMKLYSVHRLDKMTSGLLLFAKNKTAANTLSELFQRHEIEKFYLGISTRKPKKKQGWVKGDMVASRRGSYKLLNSHDNPAITQFYSFSLRERERLFLLKPHTGKTHQLRVALKSLGSPIAGDSRYAAAQDACTEERGYLHAYALRFLFNTKMYSFVCPPTQGERFLNIVFENKLNDLQCPWDLFS